VLSYLSGGVNSSSFSHEINVGMLLFFIYSGERDDIFRFRESLCFKKKRKGFSLVQTYGVGISRYQTRKTFGERPWAVSDGTPVARGCPKKFFSLAAIVPMITTYTLLT
jgi:hypothetical protein